MARIVIKFGGSSLKQKSDIQKIIRIVKTYESPVIVVSAIYGLTDALYSLLQLTGFREISFKDFKNKLEKLFSSILDDNILIEDIKRNVDWKFQTLYEQLEFLLKQYDPRKDDSLGIKDHILSYGERFSALLLSEILKSQHLDCEQALPEDIKLFTTGEFGKAKVDFTLSGRYLKEALDKKKIYIIPGFYGISKDHKVTLLGRGGSDYSAAAIANCVDADYLDIWKDVDGFLSADPLEVSATEKISKLTYAEAAELAYFGAKILHPNTIDPLIKKQIPIRIFNFQNAESKQPSTYINGHSHISKNIIKSVTSSTDFSILRLRSLSLGINPGIIAKTASALDLAGINIKSIITSQIEINILLSKSDISPAFLIVKELLKGSIEDITTDDQISVLATVGEGIKDKPGIAARIFGAVARKGINVQMISFGSSQVSAYFIVENNDKQKAIEEIHNEFFNSK